MRKIKVVVVVVVKGLELQFLWIPCETLLVLRSSFFPGEGTHILGHILLKEQYHDVFAQNLYKWRKCSLNLWNNNFKKTLNDREEFPEGISYCNNIFSKISQISNPNLNTWKKVHPEQFSKIYLILQSISVLTNHYYLHLLS